MANIGELKVSTQELRNSAGEFRKEAGQVKTTTGEMLNLIKGISEATWSGDAAEKFKHQFGKLSDDMDKMYRMILEYSGDLEDIANQYDKTEQANQTLAESLSVDVL